PASTAAAATIAAVAAAAAAEAAFRFRPRLVDGQRASAHLELVQFTRGLLCFLVGRHLDERKPAGPARRGVAHHANRFDGSGSAEQLLQLRFPGRVRKIPDVQPSTHHALPRSAPDRYSALRCRSPNKVDGTSAALSLKGSETRGSIGSRRGRSRLG